MKRKFIGLLVALLILIQPIQLMAAGFTDVPKNDWCHSNVTRIADMGGFSGYPDGSFRPKQTMTRAEFIKATVSLLGYDNVKPTGTHWASGYIDKATKLKLICPDMTQNLDQYITRYDMARISSKVLTYQNTKPDNHLAAYSSQIKDIDKVPVVAGDVDLKTAVLHSFANGIITGYPDGTFSGANTLTRAEAATVLLRLVDESLRVAPAAIDQSSDYAVQVLDLVNAERKKVGLGPLVMDPLLQYVAGEKSKDMAVHKYFDHDSPNYGSPFDMMKSFGVNYKAAGENIAMGFKTPKDVVKGWMDSPGHRANILSEKFGKIGIGVYFGDRTYWTQLFTN
ncbi:MAG: S-layer homology domain-containing protein [Gudongella sp.]|jgi:uncharacterized YkwD family protein|nr:S-layer homology domain-containing protein [Gudongella sp.]